MNIVVLKGNVGQDPKVTTFENGGKVAQFSLATTERGFKTKDGKDVPDRTDWHNVVVAKTGLAGVVEEFVKKGTPVLIHGKLRQRSYEKDGETRYISEVYADELELLGSGKKREDAPAPEVEDYKPVNDLPF